MPRNKEKRSSFRLILSSNCFGHFRFESSSLKGHIQRRMGSEADDQFKKVQRFAFKVCCPISNNEDQRMQKFRGMLSYDEAYTTYGRDKTRP